MTHDLTIDAAAVLGTFFGCRMGAVTRFGPLELDRTNGDTSLPKVRTGSCMFEPLILSMKPQEFIEAFMPDGWRAEIDLVTAKNVGYDGVKH